MVRDPARHLRRHKDNVWLSGSAKEDNQILKFTNNGKFLIQIGHSGKNQRQQRHPRTSAAPPACSFIRKTNELFVADGYFNHRVIVFDAETGAYKTALGRVRQRGRTTIYKFPSRAQLVQGAAAPQLQQSCACRTSFPNDELVYVADRTNNRLQVFRLDGTFVKETFIARTTRYRPKGPSTASPLSPDKDQKFLYVLDGSNKAIRVLNRQTLDATSRPSADTPDTTRVSSSTPIASPPTRKATCFIGEVNNGQRYYRYAYKGMGTTVPASR